MFIILFFFNLINILLNIFLQIVVITDVKDVKEKFSVKTVVCLNQNFIMVIGCYYFNIKPVRKTDLFFSSLIRNGGRNFRRCPMIIILFDLVSFQD